MKRLSLSLIFLFSTVALAQGNFEVTHTLMDQINGCDIYDINCFRIRVDLVRGDLAMNGGAEADRVVTILASLIDPNIVNVGFSFMSKHSYYPDDDQGNPYLRPDPNSCIKAFDYHLGWHYDAQCVQKRVSRAKAELSHLY